MQERVRAEARRWNVVNCGRRWGKTCLALDLAYETALDGMPAGWFAPTYKLLNEPWREAKSTLKPLTVRTSETEKQIVLEGGGLIDFWTLDNSDAGRGRKYARSIIDEAAMVKRLEEAWGKAIRPTLTDLEGDGWMFSTPRGRGFFYTMHCLGMDPHEYEYAAWTMPTASNPYMPAEEIEAARRQLPDRVFRQEYLAEFLEDFGGVFRLVKDAVDFGRRLPEPPQPGRHYLMGVDLARVEDFTVLSVIDDTGRQVYFERFNQISWERQLAAIKAVSARYKAAVTLEVNGIGDPVHEQARKAGVNVKGFTTTASTKESAIDNLAMRIEQGKARLMDVPEQTNELLAYQYELTPSRNVRMNAPEGLHDDTVMALALAYWGLANRRILRVS
jgi:hypothetical protein